MFLFVTGDSVEGNEEILTDVCEDFGDDFQGEDLEGV